jgi:hypothetical protein
MTIKATIKIAQADHPTLNGNLYPKDELEKAIKKRDEYYVIYGTSEVVPFGTIPLEDIAGKVSELAVSERGTVTGKIQALKTPKGEILNGVMQQAYFNPVFTGIANVENGIRVIRDVSLLYVSVDPTTAFVFDDES